VSGPLLDRIDLHLEVPRVSPADLISQGAGEPSAAIRGRVLAARERQRIRFGRTTCNALMSPRQARRHCRLDDDARTFLRATIDRLSLSARAYDRILRIARTIADLDGRDEVLSSDLAEAVQYRVFDRPLRLLS
jgi:magnesium chelatase family protein